jgi:phosphate transport system substrate-binding protein
LKKQTLFIAIVICLLIAGSTPISFAQEASKKAIRVNGAAVSSDQVQIWAKLFMEANPGVQVIVTGSSAGKGIDSLIEKNAEIAMASRVISTDEEKKAVAQGIQLGDRQIGYSGIAVITAPRNTVSDLSIAQLRKIFLGEYRNWNEVGGMDAPIRCLTRRVPESGGAVFFKERVLDNSSYGPTTTTTESWTTIIKVCSTANDVPIGIAPVIPALAAGVSIKVLAVKEDDYATGIKPTEETLKNKSYPIILPFRFYWDRKTITQPAEQFIQFCAGQGLPNQH